MSTLAHSERGRVGVSLVGVGTLLLVLSMLMLGSAPGAQATHEGGGGFPTQDCPSGSDAGGYKVEINDDTWVGSFDEAHGVAEADVTWSITSPNPLPVHTVLNPSEPNPSDPKQYFNYHYIGSGFQLEGVFLKIGKGQVDSSHLITASTNPGSVLLPNGISHVTLCFSVAGTPTTTTTTVPDTTTTTVADTTTTTVADTTTTTVADTTTTTVADTTTTTVPDTTTTTVADTTTTTVADTTTTTVAGPEEPTTTTTVADTTTTVADTTTTTVAGPDEPELPETGAGHFLALMAGALGLLLLGSGSLVIASDRRRQFTA